MTEIQTPSLYTLRLAEPADVVTLHELRREATQWVHDVHGIDQWPTGYPEELFLAAIARGETYMVDFETTAAATITIGHEPDTRKWSPELLCGSAVYISKLMVSRRYSGKELGAKLLDFADGLGHSKDVTWIRLDAWTDNEELHNYYRRLGFECMNILRSKEFDSGAIFQRKIPSFPYISTQLSGAEQFLTAGS